MTGVMRGMGRLSGGFSLPAGYGIGRCSYLGFGFLITWNLDSMHGVELILLAFMEMGYDSMN
jgi:hypothetical protein